MSESKQDMVGKVVDVLAFVADCEAVAIAADWPDMLRLIAIVREQGALLETALVAADVAATALEMCAAENDSLRNSRIALEEQAWRISEERDALRERLAKLEDGIRGFTSEEGDDLAEVLMDDRPDRNDPSWQSALNEHRRGIETLRALLVCISEKSPT